MTTMTIRGALVSAAMLLAFAASLVLAVRLDLITSETQHRAMGVVFGLMVALSANAVPKTFKSLANERCEPAQAQALRRFTGWALVLAGLGHALAWIVLPIEHANLAAMSIVAGALLVVAIRAVAGRRGAAPPSGDPVG